MFGIRPVILATATALVTGAAGCGLIVDYGPDRTVARAADGGGGAGASGGAASVGGGTAGSGGSAPHPDACPSNADVAWVKTYGDASFDFIRSTADDGEGGLYISGWFAGEIDFGGGPLIALGERDFFIARLDEHGDQRWARRYGTVGMDEVGPLLESHPDGVVLSGTAYSVIDLGDGAHIPNEHDGYLALLDGEGNLTWERWFGGPGEQRGWGGASTDPISGDVYATFLFGAEITAMGQTHIGLGSSDMLVVRLDRTTGTVEAALPVSTTGTDRLRDVEAIPGRGVMVAGWSDGDVDWGDGPLLGDAPDPIAALLDHDLDPIWGHRYVGTENESISQARRSANEDVWIVGTLPAGATLDLGGEPLSSSSAGGSGFIARLDIDTGLATEQAPLPQFSGPGHLAETPDGDLIVSGRFNGTITLGGVSFTAIGNEPDAIAFRLAPAFVTGATTDIEWAQTGSPSEHFDEFATLTSSDDGAVYLGGAFNDTLAIEGCSPRPTAGSTDAVIIKRLR